MSHANRMTALVSLSKLVAAQQPRMLASLPGLQSRWLSDISKSGKDEAPDQSYTYTGPFSVAVRRVKKLSLFSFLCAVGAGPVIIGLDSGAAFTAKASIAGTLLAFGTATTGLLHWFTSPYVHKLIYDPSKETIEVDSLSLLARPKKEFFKLADIRPAETVHPLASFSVSSGSYYHVDADHFKYKKLLAKLVPQPEQPVAEGEQPPLPQKEQQQQKHE